MKEIDRFQQNATAFYNQPLKIQIQESHYSVRSGILKEVGRSQQNATAFYNQPLRVQIQESYYSVRSVILIVSLGVAAILSVWGMHQRKIQYKGVPTNEPG